MNKNLCVTLEDVTVLDDREDTWELYFLVLGYDLTGKADQTKTPYVDGSNDFLGNVITSKGLILKKWFYSTVTPIFQIERTYKHSFPGGLPLHYGESDDVVSFYFAILDSDQPSRNIGEAINKIFINGENKAVNSFLDEIGELLKKADDLPIEALKGTIKQAFGLLINSVTTILINNKDDLKYTNVFTFASYNNYLIGSHDDWGNQRMKFTVTSRLLEVQN
jgi:hypothetical protein